MMDREQIVRVLECCASPKQVCGDCPMPQDVKDDCRCMETISRNTLALIRKLTKDVDRLAKQCGEIITECDERDAERLMQVAKLNAENKRMRAENERLRKTSEDGAECPTCHGIGKIGTTDWLTKHLSKEQIAKEKAEAVAEFHRELRADTVRKMQERLKTHAHAIISHSPYEYCFGEGVLVEDIDHTAKELLEETL